MRGTVTRSMRTTTGRSFSPVLERHAIPRDVMAAHELWAQYSSQWVCDWARLDLSAAGYAKEWADYQAGKRSSWM